HFSKSTRASVCVASRRPMLSRALSSAKTPLVLLAVVSLLSLGARALMLGEPCQSPCNRAGQHTLIFDEAYYVNAARVIVGRRQPPPGPRQDRHARHLHGGHDDLGDGPLPPGAAAAGRGHAGDRRRLQAGRALPLAVIGRAGGGALPVHLAAPWLPVVVATVA